MASTTTNRAAGSPSAARKWSTSAQTRQRIIDAAAELFGEFGYEHTSINDVVARSGISVGSIYHHIGGKAELFNAVMGQTMSAHGQASRIAITAAREGGVTDSVDLFLIGARAYMHANWLTRTISRITLSDDRPAGSAELQRALSNRLLEGMRTIKIGDPPIPEASGRGISALLLAGVTLVTQLDDEDLVFEVIDYYVGLVRKLAKD